MSTEYEPGSLAVITIRGRGQHNAVRDDAGNWLVGDIEDLRVIPDHDQLVTAVHPLPVVDVRNIENVDRLAHALLEANVQVANREHLVQALWSITPRPPEPLGLGAVVLDLDRKHWVRDGRDRESQPWALSTDETTRKRYDAIALMSVLNPGVPA